MNATPLLVALNILLYGLIVIELIPVVHKGKIKNSPFRPFVVSLVFLFILFPFFSGDYFHLAEDFVNMKRGNELYLEEVYKYLIDVLPNYVLLRLVIWGCAFFALKKTANLTKVPIDIILLFFAFLYLLYYSYARVSMAMSLMYWGATLIYAQFLPSSKGILYTWIGLLLIGFSCFFHKTALFGIFIIMASSIIYDMNKKKLIALFVAIPLSLGLIASLLQNILSMDATTDGLVNIHTAQHYLNEDARIDGWGIVISNMLLRTSYYLMAYVFIKSIMKGIYITFPRHIKFFGTAAFLSIIIATVFAFDLGINTYVLFYRFLNFALIPSTIFLAYCYSQRIFPKMLRFCLMVGVSGSFYTIFYSLYCAYVGK